MEKKNFFSQPNRRNTRYIATTWVPCTSTSMPRRSPPNPRLWVSSQPMAAHHLRCGFGRGIESQSFEEEGRQEGRQHVQPWEPCVHPRWCPQPHHKDHSAVSGADGGAGIPWILVQDNLCQNLPSRLKQGLHPTWLSYELHARFASILGPTNIDL